MRLDYSEIGKRIAQRRRKLGLKQAEVCEKAGISDKYLSCIERATSIPSLEVLMSLALALDTTPDEFLSGRNAEYLISQSSVVLVEDVGIRVGIGFI